MSCWKMLVVDFRHVLYCIFLCMQYVNIRLCWCQVWEIRWAVGCVFDQNVHSKLEAGSQADEVFCVGGYWLQYPAKESPSLTDRERHCRCNLNHIRWIPRCSKCQTHDRLRPESGSITHEHIISVAPKPSPAVCQKKGTAKSHSEILFTKDHKQTMQWLKYSRAIYFTPCSSW